MTPLFTTYVAEQKSKSNWEHFILAYIRLLHYTTYLGKSAYFYLEYRATSFLQKDKNF